MFPMPGELAFDGNSSMFRRSRRRGSPRGGVGARVVLVGLLFGLCAGPQQSAMGALTSGPARGGESLFERDWSAIISAGVAKMADNPTVGGGDAMRVLIRRAFKGMAEGSAGLRDTGEPAGSSQVTNEECVREEAAAADAAAAADGRGVGMDKCTGVQGNKTGPEWCSDTYFGGRAGCCFDAATGSCAECLAAPDCAAAKLGCAARRETLNPEP